MVPSKPLVPVEAPSIVRPVAVGSAKLAWEPVHSPVSTIVSPSVAEDSIEPKFEHVACTTLADAAPAASAMTPTTAASNAAKRQRYPRKPTSSLLSIRGARRTGHKPARTLPHGAA